MRDNVFLGQSDPLVRYQNYDLVHQLAHLYLQDGGLTSQTQPKEVMDWNGCVNLGWAPFEGGPSARNPFNLVYYAACEWCLVHTRVHAKLIGWQLSIRSVHICQIHLCHHSWSRQIKRGCSLLEI